MNPKNTRSRTISQAEAYSTWKALRATGMVAAFSGAGTADAQENTGHIQDVAQPDGHTVPNDG